MYANPCQTGLSSTVEYTFHSLVRIIPSVLEVGRILPPPDPGPAAFPCSSSSVALITVMCVVSSRGYKWSSRRWNCLLAPSFVCRGVLSGLGDHGRLLSLLDPRVQAMTLDGTNFCIMGRRTGKQELTMPRVGSRILHRAITAALYIGFSRGVVDMYTIRRRVTTHILLWVSVQYRYMRYDNVTNNLQYSDTKHG